VKKDTLLKGTLILAAAALVARALGVVQRVPLDYILGPLGQGYLAVANNIYLLLLVVATAGIPSAVSKMVSERYALGRVAEAQQVYRAAQLFGAGTGIIITLGMVALAPWIAGPILHAPAAASAIRAIAPSLLLFPSIAMMRGYFQGRQLMAAGGLSQIVEQILRVAAAVAIGFILYGMYPGNDERVAAGATLGSVLGSVGAFLVMVYYGRKLKISDRANPPKMQDTSRKLSRRQIYRELFRLSIPIVMTAITVQFVYTLDTMMVKSLTRGHFAPDVINEWWGILGFNAQAIAGIPVILAVALSQSIIPVISSAHAVKDSGRVGSQSSLAVRLALFTGMPVVLLLSVGAYSVNGLIFKEPSGSAIVAMLTCGTIFQICMMITNSILLGIGQPRKATMHTITGILLKVVLSFALAPWLGVYGLILATSVCFIWALAFNVLSLKKRTSFRVIESKRWAGFIGTVAVTGVLIWILEQAVLGLLGGVPTKLAFLTSSFVMGIGVLAVYPALLVILNVITPQEAESYPRPVRKLLQPLFRLRRSASAGDA
jgi:stage V sporulation protein B